ncbi:MAG: dienelactone hydrolase family protein [Candidatus Baltobacteraceae bacterium]
MGQIIEFSRPDGAHAPGYYSEPAPVSHAAGVVMLEEWWGLTPHIQKTADRLANAGFRVLVPDLYRGRTASVGDEANHLAQGLDFGDAAKQDARGAAQYLKSTGSAKVGVIGFCMGGALAMLAAMHVAEFDAAVVYYGYPPPEAGDPGTIAIPVLGNWALHDEFFPIEGVDRIEARFKEAHVRYEFYRYDAKHAFHNPNELGNAGLGHHNAEYADQSWRRSVEFFAKYLR